MRFRKTMTGVETTELTGFLGNGAEINGDLRFSAVLRIDGLVRGSVGSEGELVVGETGVIEATVEVGTASIAGRVVGMICAKHRVEIHPTGKVIGDIITPSLTIQEGAVFEGTCHMQGDHLAKEADDALKYVEVSNAASARTHN